MRFTRYFAVAAFAVTALPTMAQVTAITLPTPRRFSLEEALSLAESANPVLLSRQARIAGAEGAREETRAWLFNNPELSLERTRRTLPGESEEGVLREWKAGIAQSFELAGQQAHRRSAADAALTATRAEVEETRLAIRAQVSESFYKLVLGQQRVELEAQTLKLLENTAAAIQTRRAAGEDTRLDANVALVEAERARNQLAITQEQLSEKRAELAERLQLPADALPEAVGSLPTARAPYTLASLIDSMARQPRLQALAARADSARARLKLERASAYPDVTVGLSSGREGPGSARERVTTLSLSVPLPLFKRNAAGIGQASSEQTVAELEYRAALRDAEAQVRTLWGRLSSLDARIQRLQDSMLPALDTNLKLASKSRSAGEIGLLDTLLVTRQTLDARRDLLDAQTDHLNTRIALELAAGWQP